VVTAYACKAKGILRAGQATSGVDTQPAFLSADAAFDWAQSLRSTFRRFEIVEYPSVLLECDLGFLQLLRPNHLSAERYVAGIRDGLNRFARLADWRSDRDLHNVLVEAVVWRKLTARDFVPCRSDTSFFDRLSVVPEDSRSGLGWRVVRNNHRAGGLVKAVADFKPVALRQDQAHLSPTPAKPALRAVPVLSLVAGGDAQTNNSGPLGVTGLVSPLHWSEDEHIPLRPSNQVPPEETTREQLSMARVGQGLFRSRVEAIEGACRVTGLRSVQHLRASHIKPWRDSSNAERLDGNNGLLLSPHIDHLFDQGYLSFEADGTVLFAASLPRTVLAAWNLASLRNVGPFNANQSVYLAYHRDKIFRSS
jgi:hypothetical protein